MQVDPRSTGSVPRFPTRSGCIFGARLGPHQVKIYLSILQSKAIVTGDFQGLDDLAARILAFENRYNRSAESFGWMYTRADLNRHLDRLNNDGNLRAAG